MFIQKAYRGTNELHWYILTIILVVVAMMFAQVFSLLPVGLIYDHGLMEVLSMMEDRSLPDSNIDLNVFLAFLLLSFALTLWALRGCIIRFHKKKIVDVTTGREKWDWNRIRFGFFSWAAISILLQIVSYIVEPNDYIMQFDVKKFIPLVVISFILFPFQTTFEEILTRGYLMQGLAVGLGNRWMPWIITSFSFGLLHMANPEVQKYGWEIMLINYGTTGLLLGALTLMDDGLELAIGMHAANNIFAALFVTFEDSALQTYAIFSLKELDIYSATLSGLVISALFFFICKWKYGWSDWSKLYAKVEKPVVADINQSPDLLV